MRSLQEQQGLVRWELAAPRTQPVFRVQLMRSDSGVSAARADEDSILPSEVGAVREREWRTLCVGPGDWIIVSDSLPAETLRHGLSSEARNPDLIVVEMTSALKLVEISGRITRDVLAKGCGVDFHPKRFHVGRCARTRLAGMPVLAECVADSTFVLYVARSYAAYLREWLIDAAAEFTEI